MLFSAESGAGGHPGMGMNFREVPQTYALYFGPAECVRHTFSGLAEDGDASILVINDVQTSLGLTEELVAEAVDAIREKRPQVRAFVLYTSCQTSFLGIDFRALCLDLHKRTGLCFAHVNCSRMMGGRVPGAPREGDGTARRRRGPGGPGGGFGTRRALFGMLEQCEDNGETGVLVLGGDALSPYNDLRDYVALDGIEWVRSVGDLASFDEFAACRNAALAIVLDSSWQDVADYLQQQFSIRCLQLQPSYSFAEIAADYERIDEALAGYGTVEQHAYLRTRRDERMQYAEHALQQALRFCGALELDLRLVARPYSLAENLLDYGFAIWSVNAAKMGPPMLGGGGNDEAARERLRRRAPWLVDDAAGFPGGPSGPGGPGGPGGGTGFVLQRDRPASFINRVRARPFMARSEELAWWGYSALTQLMWQLCGCARASTARVETNGAPGQAAGEPTTMARDTVTAMRGLWSNMAPSATDSNGASAVFARAKAFVVLHDVHGSATSLSYMFDMNQVRAIYSAVSLPEIVYTTGDEDAFQERIATMFYEAREFCVQEGRDVPEFVVVLGAPVSKLVGIDLQHRARLLQERLGVPALSVETSGGEPYDKGIAGAYETLYQLAAANGNATPRPGGANIIGLTQMDWRDENTVACLLQQFDAAGLQLVSDFGYSGTLADWAHLLEAERNIVVCAGGLRIAKKMEREHGIPYTTIDELDWFDEWAVGLSVKGCGRVLVIGEQLQSALVRRLLERMDAGTVDCATFFTCDTGLRHAGDVKLKSEGELVDLLDKRSYAYVIADSAYARLLPENSMLIPLKHTPESFGVRQDDSIAFSQRWLCWAAARMGARVTA